MMIEHPCGCKISVKGFPGPSVSFSHYVFQCDACKKRDEETVAFFGGLVNNTKPKEKE